jgi:tetratricopeptide (TPR) repeat protein
VITQFEAMENTDQKALDLMESANRLIQEGEPRRAASLLARAAQIHHDAGRSYDEARCSQMAASLLRSVTDVAGARKLAEHAAELHVDDPALSVSIAAELAELAHAEARFDVAVNEWSDALAKADTAGLNADGMSALLRRRGTALIATGRFAEAESDFNRAFDLTRSVRGADVAAFVLIEYANRLFEAGHFLSQDEAERLDACASETTDAHLKGEYELLLCRIARSRGELQEAESFAQTSRAHALQAVAPLTYFSAGMQLADMLQMTQRYARSYAVLATTWATLSDLLGNDVAASWVEPILQGYRASWGEAVFHQAKSEYEAQRRAETGEKP